MDKPDWLKNEILKGLQALMLLRLRGYPAADTIQAVANVWIFAISRRPIAWNEGQDRWRVRKAFIELAATCTEFPAPSAFIAMLPPRKQQLSLPAPVSRTMSAENRARLDNLLAGMRKKTLTH